MLRYARAMAVASASLLVMLLVPAAGAGGGTTYEIPIGQEFFERGVPGVSLRIYPPSVRIEQGDVLHFFGFGAPLIHPEGEHPEEWNEAERAHIGDPYADVVPDPDDGPDDFKFNDAFELADADCSSAADPCEYDGSGDDVFNPGFVPEAWIEIDADPGTVLWGSFATDSYMRIQVVDNEEPSTQDELDAHAARLMENDFNTMAALHSRYSSRRSSHVTPGGRRVWDAWAGVDRGPMLLEAFYPRRLTIKKGDRVQWHFDLDTNVHSVAVPFGGGAEIVAAFEDPSSGYGPQCDPDGDDGDDPDVPPEFTDEGPQCPEGSVPEFDINPAELQETGNGRYTGRGDFEFSSVRGPEALQAGFFRQDPFTVRFARATGKKGIRYVCTVHFPFMDGRIRVKR